MDFSISEEQRALVDSVRKVCQKEFAPRAIKYLDGTWPAENMKTLAEIGVLGMAVPPEYGGSGLGILDTVLVLEEIGKVCYVTAMAVLGEVGVQTRIIAGARAFVGTCGSVAWLAPMLGVPTSAYFVDPKWLHAHLGVALRATHRAEAARFSACDLRALHPLTEL